MNINATLFGQMLTFFVLVLFTMKFVWPPIVKALNDRQKKIADGLAAAERGERELELAQHKSTDFLREAKLQAIKLIEQADKRAAKIVDDAKVQAKQEADKIMLMSRQEIEQERKSARDSLSQEIAGIAIGCAEKLLQTNIDVSANSDMMTKLIAEVSGE